MAGSSEVQGLLDEISQLLAAPATLESPEFELIAFGVHDAAQGASGELDPVRMRSILGRSSTPETRDWFESFGIATASGPVRTPADAARGIGARLCLPVRHAGRLLGYVWLLDDGHLTSSGDPGRASTQAVIGLVARLAAVLAASAPPDLAPLMPVRVVVGQVRPAEGLIADEVDGQPVHLVAADATDGAVRGGPAGVGGVAGTPAELARSYGEAVYAARVAAAVPALGPVGRWDDLGAFRLLRDVVGPDPVLETLAETPELLETLEVFLDRAGNVAQAAAALHIHRQTLYYRLTRIEALSGCNLSDGQARLLLHMSVKLARLGRTPVAGEIVV